MFNRLKNLLSRKFLVTILTPIFTGLLLRLNAKLPVAIEADLMGQIVTLLVALAIAYILGESVRDSVAAANGK